MLVPLSDDDRALSGPAFVTGALLLINVVVFVMQLVYPELMYAYSTVPFEITTGQDLVNSAPVDLTPSDLSQIPQRSGPTPIYLTLLSSMFMHVGLAHLVGNLLYLWIFGDNVEHRFGHGPFLAFYFVSGFAASAAQIALEPGSVTPMLGASGAISGVLGAYLVLFPRNRIHAVFLVTIVSVPAIVAIGLWIAFQLVNGAWAIAAAEQSGGVAYGAHIGGFFAGVMLAFILRRSIRERPNRLTHAAQADAHSGPLW